MNNPLVFELIHWTALLIATAVSYLYFRDLGDVTQVVLGVKRKNMIFAIRHENAMVATGLLGTAVFTGLHFWLGVGVGWVTITMLVLNLVFVCLPWLWLHIGLRNQQDKAKFYPIDEAKDWVRPEESVIVIDHNGEARAHSDYHIKRPHLVGTPEGLGGENVIMTYCCMTHLGQGFKPEIDGKALKLEVLAQHGNNLIMKDMTTGEPIQQVYGTRECDGRFSDRKMQGWPTYRMPFRTFEKAFPQGKVFLNKIPKFSQNPLLWLFDNLVEVIFLWGTIPHDRNQSLLFNTMDVDDKRLRRKEYVWGFDVAGDAVAYTEMFIRESGGLINAKVGGRAVVVAYDAPFESVGVYYNDSGQAVKRVDFWGESDQGKLQRVESVKAGIYWCVWANFFPETALNRISDNTSNNTSDGHFVAENMTADQIA